MTLCCQKIKLAAMATGARNQAGNWPMFYQRRRNQEIDMTAKSSRQGGNSSIAGKTSAGKVAMTPARASAIQSQAMKTAGTVKTGSFAARAQAGADRNVNVGIVPSTPTGKP